MSFFQPLIHPAEFDEPSLSSVADLPAATLEALRVARCPKGSILSWRIARHWKSIVLFTVLALVVLGGCFTAAQDKTAKDPKREANRLAIDKLTKDI
jgi:hypothetical protein